MKKRFYILIMCLSLFPILASATDGSLDMDSRYEYYYSYQYDAIDTIYEQIGTIYEQIENYYNNSQYDDAIELGERLLSRYPNHTTYYKIIWTYWILAKCYQSKKEYCHAIELLSKARDYYTGSRYLLRDFDMETLSKEIGDCYYCDMRNYEEALKYYDEVSIPSVLFDIAVELFKRKDYDHSIYYAKKANKIYRDQYKEFISEPALLYALIATDYYYKGDLSSAYTKLRESLNMLHPYILGKFRSCTATERTDFWNEFSWIFQSVFPSIAFAANNQISAGNLYDMSSLFAKGILLNSDTEFDRLILESDDSLAIDEYRNLQNICNQIRIYELTNRLKWNHTQLEELQKEKDLCEKRLLIYLRWQEDSLGDFTQNLKITWRDVREKLSDDDIAIEFLSFPELGSDKTFYIALTVRKDYDRPHMVFLGEENELKAAAKKAYTSNELSQLIWGKLSDELKRDEEKDTVNIYFSPSGILHQVAIESMPHWENTDLLMNQCYNIYRLSSTRELVIERNSIQLHAAAVYGDINYNTKVKLLPTSHTANDASFLAKNRGFDADSAGYRGKIWNPLKYTKDEIDSIFDILKNTEIMVDSMTVDAATETSFKDLTGKKKSIIHIATHGFCWNDSIAGKYNMKNQLSFMIGENYEDKVMSRTGLLFSGANNCFADSVKIPNDKDDGVLTAEEASLLDLRGLDLLVLSACQTGRGEVIGGEGVFGLQRGFKKAGARSIIMSLWSVNDKATSEMMTKFYHYYFTEGMAKQEAFLEAQKYIKDKYGNYKDEEQTIPTDKPHWAAFILLDALDKR